MTIHDFFSILEQDNEHNPGAHVLETSLTTSELEKWRTAFPHIVLPSDFVQLLQQHNGFRIRPDKDTPTGVIQLLPLREIRFAPHILYGGDKSFDDEFPQSWMAITDDSDGSQFVILDAENGQYLDVDPIGPHDPDLISEDLEGFLDWLIQFREDDENE